MNTSPFLTTADAAQRLGCSASYLNKLRLTGDGCPYSKMGSKVLYAVADLDAWVEARKRRSTSEHDTSAVA